MDNPITLKLGRWQDVLADVQCDALKVIDSFISKLSTPNERGCILWNGHCDPAGYGKFQFWDRRTKKQKRVRAPRFALAVKLGRWPGGNALHSCDTPRCCNPEHLREGSQKENIAEMDSRGRRGVKPLSSYLRGDAHPFRKDPSLAATGDRHGSRTKPECILRGEDHPHARLSVAEVKQVRAQRGFISVSSLAKTFGVSRKAIQLILDGKNWAHV